MLIAPSLAACLVDFLHDPLQVVVVFNLSASVSDRFSVLPPHWFHNAIISEGLFDREGSGTPEST